MLKCPFCLLKSTFCLVKICFSPVVRRVQTADATTLHGERGGPLHGELHKARKIWTFDIWYLVAHSTYSGKHTKDY